MILGNNFALLVRVTLALLWCSSSKLAATSGFGRPRQLCWNCGKAPRFHERNKRWHEGKEIGRPAVAQAAQSLSKLQSTVGWKCPLCQVGAAASTWSERRRAEKHPRVTKNNGKRLLDKGACELETNRAACRGRALIDISSQIIQLGPDYDVIIWFRVTKKIGFVNRRRAVRCRM